jgi:hypothetical protein
MVTIPRALTDLKDIEWILQPSDRRGQQILTDFFAVVSAEKGEGAVSD